MKEYNDDDFMDELQALYDAWKKGEKSDEEYCLYLVNNLEFYIKSIIREKGRTMGAEMQDLMQQGRLAIVSEFRRYNPYQTKPTSFFKQYISQYTKDITEKKALTKYYLGIKTKLDKVAKENGYRDMLDPDLDYIQLSIYADIPVTTILETKHLVETVICNIDNCVEVATTSKGMGNPEKEYIEKETQESIRDRFKNLTPLMSYIIFCIYYEDEPLSFRQIVNNLKNSPELLEKYKDEIGDRIVEQTFIEMTYNRAIRILRKDMHMQAIAGISNKDAQMYNNDDQYEVIYSDIEDAFSKTYENEN